MLWGDISKYGTVSLLELEGREDSQIYVENLQENLLPFAAENMRESWVYQK